MGTQTFARIDGSYLVGDNGLSWRLIQRLVDTQQLRVGERRTPPRDCSFDVPYPFAKYLRLARLCLGHRAT